MVVCVTWYNDISRTGVSDSGRSINFNKHLCLVVSTWYFSQLNYANYLQIIWLVSLGKTGFVALGSALVSSIGQISRWF